eukprot:4168811-Pleurochrysis_carterae.AAC.4
MSHRGSRAIFRFGPSCVSKLGSLPYCAPRTKRRVVVLYVQLPPRATEPSTDARQRPPARTRRTVSSARPPSP